MGSKMRVGESEMVAVSAGDRMFDEEYSILFSHTIQEKCLIMTI